MANKTMHHVVIGENTYEIVDQYAREHGGSDVTIDPTLSQSGQAADAKATGDAIGEVNGRLVAVSEATRNLFDITKLTATGITITGEAATGTANAFLTAFRNGIPNLGIAFEENTQYTISLIATNNGTKTNSNGLKVYLVYTDNTKSENNLSNSSDNRAYSFTSTSGKTVSTIAFAYGNEGTNEWTLSDIQLEKGTQKTEYVPHLSATDSVARTQIASLSQSVADNSTMVDILAVQNYVKVTRPRVINGALSTSTGERVYTLSQVNSYCITPDLLHVAKGSTITKANTTMRIYKYNSDGSFVSYFTVNTSTLKYVFAADEYVRLFFLVSGAQNMTPKAVFDSVTFDLALLNYTEPDIITSFLGLNGEKGTVERSIESGEACIIQFPNSENMEIDFHIDRDQNNAYYRDSLALRGVRRLDYIVISHYHNDHIGLIEKAISYGYIYIDGATVFLPQLITEELASQMPEEWQTYYERQNALISMFESHSCTIIHPVDGDELNIGGAVIQWYNCDHSAYYDSTSGYHSNNYNDCSLCFNLRYWNTVINYTGDLGPIGQRKMGGKMPKADILKAMHHGWDNGVNNLIPAFINNVSPNMVVVCNGYAHRPTSGNQQEPNMLNASSPIYSWAEANGVPAYPTCTNGNIDILINKYGYRLDGHYTRFIRNDKNWSYSDNSEHIES
jgi:hypothetical protein